MTTTDPVPVASTATKAGRFQLVRYFSLTATGLFILVALALTYFERDQSKFFQTVQEKQNSFFKQVQDGFSKQQDAAARRDLLTIHEAGNVNLTRLFSNTLWANDFAPFVAQAQSIPVDHCRAIADIQDPKDGKMKSPDSKKACFSDLGKQIAAFKEFPALNAKVFDAMKKTSVFKIKVFDLRGITVYSSEHAQMGEDKAFNAGWKGAAGGKVASEMTFRGKFSAFEGVVENRDLIGSYLPVLAPGTEKIVGVFEVYSDVTPFLDQIKATSAQIRKASDDNQTNVEKVAAENQIKVDASSSVTLLIVLGLLAVLFTALYAIVRRADRILVKQEEDREQYQQQIAQSEKMASLGQMVAGVAHQLNTPLAYSHSNVSMVIESLNSFKTPLLVAGKLVSLVKGSQADSVNLNISKSRAQIEAIEDDALDVELPVEMLNDTLNGIMQMRELVENLRDFTRLDRSKTAEFDLNKGLHNVVYMARSVIPSHIEVIEAYGVLPKIECNASQLNQVFLNLINNAAQSILGEEGTVTVRSSVDGNRVRVDVHDTGTGIAPDVLPHIFDNYYTTKSATQGTGLGLAIARTIVEQHGGEITVLTEVGKGSVFTVFLPVRLGDGADAIQAGGEVA